MSEVEQRAYQRGYQAGLRSDRNDLRPVHTKQTRPKRVQFSAYDPWLGTWLGSVDSAFDRLEAANGVYVKMRRSLLRAARMVGATQNLGDRMPAIKTKLIW